MNNSKQGLFPFKIHLNSKQLLYRCDVRLEMNFNEPFWQLKGRGTVRLGPKSSEFLLSSTYEETSLGWQLLSSQTQVPGFTIKENYSDKGADEPIEESGEEGLIPIDPGLLLALAHNQSGSMVFKIPMGGKWRRVEVLERDSKREVFVKNKSQGLLEKRGLKTQLTLSSLKIKLFIEDES